MGLTTRPRKRQTRVPFDCINVLTQTRSDMDDIPALAESIGEEGLNTMPWIAYLKGEEEARTYIDGINRTFAFRGVNHTFEELTPFIDSTGEKCYFVLIAGHRRRMALLRLRERGCAAWNLEFKNRASEEVFEQKYGCIYVMAYYSPTVRKAIELQALENNGRKDPKASDTVDALRALWGVSKEEDPNLTIKKFAPRVGLSESATRDRLQFHECLEVIQMAVFNNVISFGQAMVFRRIQLLFAELYEGQEMGPDEVYEAHLSFFVPWLSKCVDKPKETTIGKLYQGMRIAYENIKVGQQSLDTLFQESAEQKAKHEHAIAIANRARSLGENLCHVESWLHKVRFLKRVGLLEAAQSGWRHDQVRQGFLRLLVVLEEFCKDLEGDLIESPWAQEGRRLASRGRSALGRSEHLVTDIAYVAN